MKSILTFAGTFVLLALASPAGAAPSPGKIVERPVASDAPDADVVRESFVRVYDPLPESTGPHPAACDWVSYLRFRSATGPRDAKDADAVVVLIPGFLGGASSFDQLARNTVRTAARQGQDIEVWPLDRRANCLEDHTGTHAAAEAEDATIAWDYYWGDAEVDGRRFGGFVPASDAEFLSEFGLERTMRDWYTVLKTGIPGQKRRKRMVICGGHSLGGPLTAAFAGWDFDGNPETKRDAGYNQCAGLVGLDTRLAVGTPGGGGINPVGLIIDVATATGPYVSVPPLTPETFQVPAVFGVGAFFDPSGTDLLGETPHTLNIDLSQRLLFSSDAVNFATGVPSIRDFNLTNEVALGGIFDDNSQPLGFIRASVGFLTGGALKEKNFPAPDGTLALPAEPDGPLYEWQSYRAVGANGAPIAPNESGEPYTSRESEASDLHQFARTLFEAPANFIEQYFPTRILTDVSSAAAGERGGSLSGLRYDGVSKRPAILIQAGDSDSNDGEDGGRPFAGDAAPNDDPLSSELILPGYNHLDVLAAARRQNDGRPEPSSTALADFTISVVAPPGR